MASAAFFDGTPPSPTILPSSIRTRERRAYPVDGPDVTASTESVKGVATGVVARMDQKSNVRFGIIVDTQNIKSCALRRGIARVDYRQIVADICPAESWFGIACVAEPVNGSPIARFSRYLESVGFRVAVWQSPMICGKRKVNLDSLLVSEATRMVLSLRLDALYIVGADVDYAVLADICHAEGMGFGIAAFPESLSLTLARRADRVLALGSQHAASFA